MTKYLLIVEDDNLLAKVYEDKLKKADVETIVLADGREVFQTAKKYLPRLIILDMMMPFKDGFEVLKELRNDQATKNIPVVVLTALSQPDDIETARVLGAKEFLTKTKYTFNDVKTIIDKYLGE